MTINYVHLPDPLGDDRSLCGDADEGNMDNNYTSNYYGNVVTCPLCTKIINACYEYKAAQLRVERTAEVESENDVNAAEDGGVVQQDIITVNREELIALLEVTISRGENLGYIADADYKEWLSRVQGVSL